MQVRSHAAPLGLDGINNRLVLGTLSPLRGSRAWISKAYQYRHGLKFSKARWFGHSRSSRSAARLRKIRRKAARRPKRAPLSCVGAERTSKRFLLSSIDCRNHRPRRGRLRLFIQSHPAVHRRRGGTATISDHMAHAQAVFVVHQIGFHVEDRRHATDGQLIFLA